MNDTFGIDRALGACRAPLGLGHFLIRTQGGARSSLALGWLVDGPLARGDGACGAGRDGALT